MSDIPIATYVNQRLNDLDVRLSEQREDLKDRLKAMNEIREAMRDQSSHMATRGQLEDVKIRLNDVEKSVSWQAGQVSLITALLTSLVVSALWWYAVS